MVHGDGSCRPPCGHVRLHRDQRGLSGGSGYRVAQRLPIRRYQQDGRRRPRHLALQQLCLLDGAVILGGDQKAQLHIQILRRLLHALAHGGHGAVPIPQDDGQLQQRRLVVLFAGGEGQQPEQYA